MTDMSTEIIPLWPPAADNLADQAGALARSAVDASGNADLLDRFVSWPLHNLGRAVRSFAVAIGVVVAAIRLPMVVDGEWANFREILWYEAITLAWLLLATIYVRTITPRQTVSFWLVGIFVAGPLADALGTVLNGYVAGNAFGAVIVPPLEEGIKLLPVVIFAVLMSRAGRGFGVADLFVLGAAVGAGFALYEDMLWGRAFVSGFEGWGVLFPTVLQDPVFAAGHLVWTAGAALGVGVLFLHRQKLWAWIAGPVLIVVPLVDHAVVNYRGEEYDTMRSALLGGRLTILLIVVTLVVAIMLESRIVSDSGRGDHLFAPVSVRELLSARLPPAFGAATSARQLQRFRNDAVYRRHVGKQVRLTAATEVAAIEAVLHTAPASNE